MKMIKHEKKTIAVDVDDVSLDFVLSFVRFYNARYGTDFVKKDFFSYDLWKVLGITKEKITQRMSLFYESDYFDEIEPVQDAQEALYILNQKRNNVFVTSRPIKIKLKTDLSLRRNFKDSYSETFYSGDFNGQGKSKAEICKELGAFLIIEDCLKYALDCSSHGIPVFLVDQPWNQNGDLSNTLVTRIKGGWSEILGKISSRI
jgi:uncharacterized HAD superfamily protein